MSQTQDVLTISRVRREFADGTLRQLRKNAQLRQAEIARAAGISREAYAAYEAGRRTPRPEIALRIGAILDALAKAAS